MSELVELGSDGQVVGSSEAVVPKFDDLANRLEQALVAQQARLALAQHRRKANSEEVTRLEGEREGMAAEAGEMEG